MNLADTARIAAHQSADSTAALLLYQSEGHFGDVEVVEKLAEALALTIDLQISQIEDCDHKYRGALKRLKNACTHHIEGWVG